MEKETLRQAWTNKMNIKEPNLKMVNFCIDNGGRFKTTPQHFKFQLKTI